MRMTMHAITLVVLACLLLADPGQVASQGPGDPALHPVPEASVNQDAGMEEEPVPGQAEDQPSDGLEPDAGQGVVDGPPQPEQDEPQDIIMGTQHENIFIGENPVSGDSMIIVTPPPREEDQDQGLGDMNIEINVNQ